MVLFSKKKKDFSIPDGGLDSVEKLMIGGVEQTILIQAMDLTHPVLLFVHGGPCMPLPGVVSRGQDYAVAISTKELVKNFVVVFWDQRGAGKSYHPSIPAESLRVEQFIEDCNVLVDHLRERFSQEKIYLAAHSWGTVIGLEMASRYPEKLNAYIGISQIINWAENDRFCYEWLREKAEQNGDTKTLRGLDKLGTPPYLESVKQWTTFRRYLMKYNSMVYESESVKSPGMKGAFKLFLGSTEYSLKDIFHTFYSSFKLTYTQEIIEDFAKIDFSSLCKIDTPVYFINGSHDDHVDGRAAEDLYNRLEAPFGKDLIWYDKSSHMFHPDDTREIEKYLIEVVKK